MAIITWQNVPLPHLSGAQEGIRTAGELFNRASQNAQNIAGIIQDHQENVANRAILDRVLAAQDPQQYAQQLAGGQIVGRDGGNASLDFLRSLSGHVDTLQKRADTQYKSDRTRMLDADLDRISPDINEALARNSMGDPVGGSLTLLGSGGHIANTAEHYRPMLQQGMALDRIAAKGKGKDDQRKLSIQTGIAEVTPLARSNPGLAEERILSYPLDEQAEIRAGISKVIPGFGEKVAGIGARLGNIDKGTLEGSGAAYESKGYRTVLNHGQIPQADGTVADVSPMTVMGKELDEMNGTELEIYAKHLGNASRNAHPDLRKRWGYDDTGGGEPKLSTAMGKYQILWSTLQAYAPRVLGPDWKKSQVLTPENQDKLAKAIFEDNKRGDLHAVWPSLPPAFREKGFSERYGISFEDIRPLLGNGEVGRVPPPYRKEAENFRQAFEEQRASLSNEAKAIHQAKGNSDWTKERVLGDISKSPVFGEDDLSRLGDYLDEIKNLDPSLTYAEAGEILKQSKVENRFWQWEFFDKQGRGRLSDERFQNFVRNIKGIRTEIKDFEESNKDLRKLEELETQYEQELGNWGEAAFHLRNNPTDHFHTRNYIQSLSKLDQTSQKLKKLTEGATEESAAKIAKDLMGRPGPEDPPVTPPPPPPEGIPQGHVDAINRGYSQQKQRGISPSEALSRTQNTLAAGPMRISADVEPAGFREDVTQFNLEKYLGAAGEITEEDTAWDAYQKLKQADKNRDKLQKSLGIEDYEQALTALGYDVSKALITHRPEMRKIKRNRQRDQEESVTKVVNLFDRYVRRSLR